MEVPSSHDIVPGDRVRCDVDIDLLTSLQDNPAMAEKIGLVSILYTCSHTYKHRCTCIYACTRKQTYMYSVATMYIYMYMLYRNFGWGVGGDNLEAENVFTFSEIDYDAILD